MVNQELVPRIWAEEIVASLIKRTVIGSQLCKQEQEQHNHRMAIDPDYAKAYELRLAEDEAMSYWDALYDNNFPTEEEEEEDW